MKTKAIRFCCFRVPPCLGLAPVAALLIGLSTGSQASIVYNQVMRYANVDAEVRFNSDPSLSDHMEAFSDSSDLNVSASVDDPSSGSYATSQIEVVTSATACDFTGRLQWDGTAVAIDDGNVTGAAAWTWFSGIHVDFTVQGSTDYLVDVAVDSFAGLSLDPSSYGDPGLTEVGLWNVTDGIPLIQGLLTPLDTLGEAHTLEAGKNYQFYMGDYGFGSYLDVAAAPLGQGGPNSMSVTRESRLSFSPASPAIPEPGTAAWIGLLLGTGLLSHRSRKQIRG